MKSLASILVTVVAFGTTGAGQQAQVAGLAGTWEVEDRPMWTVVLNVDGMTVTGNVIVSGLEHEIFDGSLSGDELTFKARSADGDRVVTFRGRFEGEAIIFTREVTVAEGGVGGGNALMGAAGPAQFTVRRANPDRWTGTIRNAPTQRNPSPNPNPRQVTLATQSMPDPHWRWRGGEKNITVRTFSLPNGAFQVDTFDLDGDRLTYSFSRPGPGDEVNCELTQQPSGEFAGMCRAGQGNFNVFIALTPPASSGGQAPNRN